MFVLTLLYLLSFFNFFLFTFTFTLFIIGRICLLLLAMNAMRSTDINFMANGMSLTQLFKNSFPQSVLFLSYPDGLFLSYSFRIIYHHRYFEIVISPDQKNVRIKKHWIKKNIKAYWTSNFLLHKNKFSYLLYYWLSQENMHTSSNIHAMYTYGELNKQQ